ncbi:MAG TPA: response regulator [Leptospiraceae bacterium]|nr:response regulator [Leptospiraceae bacterium]HMY65846.1 response regulator [Leptospiraceae bacterium]HNF14149.1 response regulator [Leptospiraceae bacterium]HNF25556.1 response regulator [Leptospiraceae bacterium]HNI96816.1 response regulator [Leptospiraceae bacterium]
MKKILIVDDQPQISKILNDILVKSGYKTEVAFNGEQGYLKALEVRPDLIIMDIMMPVLSGFDSTKKIKANSEISHIPIIFLSAKGQDSDKEDAAKLGVSHFITKPFSTKNVIEIIQKILV